MTTGMGSGGQASSEKDVSLEVSVPDALRFALRRLALQEYPREACGALLGRRTLSSVALLELRAGRNIHPFPEEGFELDPADVVRAQHLGRRGGLELVGFFHSHPDQSARPSEPDRMAAWEGFLSLITAVDGCGRTRTRCYVKRAGRLVAAVPGKG